MIRTVRIFSLLVLAMSLLMGCASIKIYDENGRDRGIEFYPAKPYLLKNSTKDGVSYQVIAIPDVSRPHRIKHQGGIGATDFSVALSAGMLTSVNQKVDSKVPETITAVGSLVSSIGSLGVIGAGPAAGAPTLTRDALANLAAELDTNVANPLGASASTSGMATTVTNFAAEIRTASKLDFSATGTCPTKCAGTSLADAMELSNAKIRAAIVALAPTQTALATLAKQPSATADVVQASEYLGRLVRKVNAQITGTSVALWEIVTDPNTGKLDFVPTELP